MDNKDYIAEICDEIRDLQQCVEVKAPNATARRLGNMQPDGVLYRVTHTTKANARDGWSWWDLDDLARSVVHRENVLVGDWYLIPGRYAPHLISAFDIVGALHRLEFMAVTG